MTTALATSVAEVVVDSSVVLACINREPGFEAWLTLLEDAACSANNIAEIVAKLTVKGVMPSHAARVIAAFEFDVHPVDHDDALAIGGLHAVTSPFGLSLGDRSCLVLGKRLGLPVVTADRIWSEVADLVGVEIRQIC